ncbi:uncharacterized protein LOC132733209 [Ruditapes philippinarum]|uniref:uncharacterized protein LOC132733209 n=1 Tax=Ruditapes philippinarum TaxID=129788 RepID=UPI00295AF4CD|nr:uncharacterized protein LOC132733209 [Ruditapes philippinarum]
MNAIDTKTVEERKSKLKGCCFRCLREGHTSSDCRSSRICVYCDKSNVHHRSLCPKRFKGAEQLSKGIIEEVNDTKGDLIHYIPHHAVINPQKSTKVRVVYDASSKCKPEYSSLNECLHRGPVMLHDLCGLLMRFRLHKIAIIADIEKAFLQIEEQLKLEIEGSYIWTDSQCVIGWLQTTKKLPVFVSNRIREIKSYVTTKISYVKSKENPADVATRGATIHDLRNNKFWWNGPHWLTEYFELSSETAKNLIEDSSTVTESTNVVERNSENFETEFLDEENLSIACTINDHDNICAPFGMDSTKFSSVDKLIRTTALASRFIKKIKKQKCENQSLTSQELETSENMWILYLQRKNFSETICGIYNQKTTTLQRQLGLFIDPKRILRSKGRLENAGITEGAKQPILLPRNEWFTYLIIEKVHKQNCH